VKLAALVILYEPPDNVFNNINTYINEIDFLYIIDNSLISKNYIPDIYNKKVSYTHNNSNDGIAKSLNRAIALCKKDGFNRLLTMDQDSSFNKDSLQNYLRLVEQEKEPELISMFGIRYKALKIDDNSGTLYNQLLITSGSIINVELAIDINGFDENLFIDGVDTEFCLKSFKKGFKTVCYNQIYLNHLIGEEKKVRTLLLKREKRSYHTPHRLYYIVRNHLYLKDKYTELQTFSINWIILNEIKNCILYGNDLFKYISAIILAFKHYKNREYGKQNL
jgi:rhamnosyltransferase